MKCSTIEISNGRGTIKTMTNSTKEENTQLYDAIKLNTRCSKRYTIKQPNMESNNNSKKNKIIKIKKKEEKKQIFQRTK